MQTKQNFFPENGGFHEHYRFVVGRPGVHFPKPSVLKSYFNTILLIQIYNLCEAENFALYTFFVLIFHQCLQ